ncbi:hypothetical protein RJD24_14525 [Bacillaceae bacterium IKA-2]|nr:hypothetical protein RJD24_14525 [Bacillaceae bacterium IKA-2]
MIIEIGTEYQITERVKRNFNSAETFTIIWQNENVIQFTLKDGKGHGSMPIQHFHYLLNRKELTQVINMRSLLSEENQDQQIV